MKRIIIASAAVAAFLAAAAGSLAVFVYTRNCGVDYKGRARLDYNWKYYFTSCPKEGYRYEGKLFSFSYPKLEKENTLKEDLDINGGWVLDTYNRLDVQWTEKDEKGIKSELSGYLSSPDGLVTPSIGFMRWLVGTGPKVSVYIEKIKLKGGGEALIISGRGREDGYLPGLEGYLGHSYVFIVGLAPGGTIIKAEINAARNITEDIYRERMRAPTSWRNYPTPGGNAEKTCVLNRFIKTFEIKKL